MTKLLGIAALCVAVTLCECQMDTDAHTVRTIGNGKKPFVSKTDYANGLRRPMPGEPCA